MAFILGIDPGSRKTGFGIIEHEGGTRLRYVTSGVIRVENIAAFPERLHQIFASIVEIIAEYRPDEAAIEEVFLGRNVASALKLGQARGAAIVACMQHHLSVHEYAARKVKQAAVGNGGATKEQVQHMMKVLLSLPGLPQEDAADGLAIAICHAHTQQHLIKTAGALHSRRGRLLSTK